MRSHKGQVDQPKSNQKNTALLTHLLKITTVNQRTVQAHALARVQDPLSQTKVNKATNLTPETAQLSQTKVNKATNLAPETTQLRQSLPSLSMKL